MAAPILGTTCLAGVAAAAGGAHSVLIPLAIPVAVVITFTLIARPDTGVALAMFLLWSDALVVAVQTHGAPTAVELIVPMMLLIPLANAILRGEPVIANRGFAWMLVLFVVELAATMAMQSADQHAGILRLEKFVQEGLIVYLLVINAVRTPALLRSALWAVIAAGCFLSAATVLQTATGRLDHSFFGFALLDHSYFLKKDDQFRAQGPLGDANYYAQILIPVLALSIVFAWRERTRRARRLAAGAAALALAAIALTYSRGGALAVVAMLIVLAVLRHIKLRHLAIVVVAIAVALVAVPGYQSRLSSISISGATAETGSSAAADPATVGRATENRAALLVFGDHPLLGVGPGGFTLVYQEYAQKIGVGIHQASKHDTTAAGEAPGRAAHEIVLQLAADLGLCGVIAFAGLVIATCVPLVRLRRRLRSRPDLESLATGLLLAILGYLFAGIFLSLAYERYFWLLLALAGAAASILKREAATASADSAISAPRPSSR